MRNRCCRSVWSHLGAPKVKTPAMSMSGCTKASLAAAMVARPPPSEWPVRYSFRLFPSAPRYLLMTFSIPSGCACPAVHTVLTPSSKPCREVPAGVALAHPIGWIVRRWKGTGGKTKLGYQTLEAMTLEAHQEKVQAHRNLRPQQESKEMTRRAKHSRGAMRD